MLSNPYHKDDVIFRGARYDGLHEPLVSAELFLDAQIDAGQIEYDQAKATSKTASPWPVTCTRST